MAVPISNIDEPWLSGIFHLIFIPQKLEEITEVILDAEIQLAKKKSAPDVFSIAITKMAVGFAIGKYFLYHMRSNPHFHYI